MNGMLNVVRADEHNRALLRAAQRDRAHLDELPRAKWRIGLDLVALAWSWRSRAARAAQRAVSAPSAVPATAEPSVGLPVHPLAALAAQTAGPELPVVQWPPGVARRFTPRSDDPTTAAVDHQDSISIEPTT